MDQDNHVAPTGRGTYVVVVNGQSVGEFTSLEDAEYAFNASKGLNPAPAPPPSAPPPPSAGGAPGGTGVTRYNGQMSYDEMLRRLDSAAGGYWGGDRSNPGAILAAFDGAHRGAAPGAFGGSPLGGAGLGAIADAGAKANREDFAAKMRQQWITTFGFDPGPRFGYGPGGSSGGQSGSYTTKNGPKTLQQMRDELRASNWPGAPDAPESEVTAAYARTTGGAVTAGGGGGGGGDQGDMPASANAGSGQRIKEIYEQVRQRRGTESLAADDPQLVQAVASDLGLTPAAALRVLQAGRQYAITYGTAPPDNFVENVVNDARPHGRNPSLDVQKYLRDGEQYEKNREHLLERATEEDRRFDQGQYSELARTLISASSQMRGPRDYFRYQTMLGNGQDVLSALRGDRPQAAFGMSGDPEAARVTDLLDSLGLSSRPYTIPRQPRGSAMPGPAMDNDWDEEPQQRPGAIVRRGGTANF